MSWKEIVKRIDQNTVIEEKEEVVSLLEKMNKFFVFNNRSDASVNESGKDTYNVFSRGYQMNERDRTSAGNNPIDSFKKISELTKVYRKHHGDSYAASFPETDDDGMAVAIEAYLGEGLGIFDMRFGFFGNHYIAFFGFDKDELGQKQINFLNDLVGALQ